MSASRYASHTRTRGLMRQIFLEDLAMNYEAREIRQPARDAVLLAGLVPDRPAHPLLGGGVDCISQGAARVYLVQDVIRKVASVAAVEEDPDCVQGLARCLRNCGHGCGPRRGGVFGHRSPKAPGFYVVHRITDFM